MVNLEELKKTESFAESLKLSQQNEEYYYVTFFAYLHLDPEFYDQILNIPLIRFDPRIGKKGQWFHYECGVYKEVTEHFIYKIYFDFADALNDRTSESKTNHILRRLKAECVFTDTWDGKFQNSNNIINTLDCLIDTLTLHRYPHTPAYLSKKQVPRHLVEVKRVPYVLKRLLSAIDFEDRKNVFKFLVYISKRYIKFDLFLMLYGPKSSGKNTFCLMIEEMLGPNLVSKTPFFKLAQKFGCKECYDKFVNIHPEQPVKTLNYENIGKMKDLTCPDGGFELEFKGIDRFKIPIRVHFVFGTNQLMKFSQDSVQEIDSLMRRTVLGHFSKSQIRDVAFKDQMKDPIVLDQIFSFLLNCPLIEVYKPADMEKYIEITLQRWLLDAEPLMRIIKELFEFTPSQGMTLTVTTVMDVVKTMIEREKLTLPKDLQADITTALRSMNIYRNNARGSNASYSNIKFTSKYQMLMNASDLSSAIDSSIAIDKIVEGKNDENLS